MKNNYYLYTEKIIKKTRKPHFCFCCGKIFPEGLKAKYIVMYGDDGFHYGYFFEDEEQNEDYEA